VKKEKLNKGHQGYERKEWDIWKDGIKKEERVDSLKVWKKAKEDYFTGSSPK